MEDITVLEASAFCLKNKIPFYAYCLPNGRKYYFGAQLKKDACVFRWTDGMMNGFVMHPFDSSLKMPVIYIRDEVRFSGVTDRESFFRLLSMGMRECDDKREFPLSVGREEYDRQFSKTIELLKKGTVEKMVLSRGITVKCNGYAKMPKWFDELAQHNPSAFVFMASVPGVMTWMGATPELFLRNRDYKLTTMALAGTRPLGKSGKWGEKEQEEQEIVENYIASVLNKKCNWVMKGPFTKKAGNMEHICTEFSCTTTTAQRYLQWFINHLHPTPAVAGYPTDMAMRFIREIEREDRRYYGGFVGPVRLGNELDLFVNLRCMEVFPKAVRLFVGGGITATSDLDSEWEETELKARTLLDVIGGEGIRV